MKRLSEKCLLGLISVFAGFSAFAATTTKTVTWSLPEGWDAEVSYPTVEGYRAIVGGELFSRGSAGEIGDPDLPIRVINVALPDNGTFGAVTAEAEWEAVELDGLLPLPIIQPVPSDEAPTLPTLTDAYQSIYPTVIAKEKCLEIASGVRMMPIEVTPFKWDGTTKTLYKAKSLKVTATYTVPKSLLRLSTSSASSSSSKSKAGHPDMRKLALSMTINPDDATTASSGLRLTTSAASTTTKSLSCYGNDLTADFLIISPNKFVNLWKSYADFRKKTELGKNHEFAVVNTKDIYANYTTEHDDALKIHHYIEGIYKQGKIKYVLLGAAPKKYNYDAETMIPARYVVAQGGLNQLLDEYYGCMDRLPTDSGVEVWDWDGDGYYMGSKVNGSFTHDPSSKIDFKIDIIVFRFPLMDHVVDSGYDFTAGQVITNFMNKVTHLESPDYKTKYDYCLSGSTVFGTVYRGGTGDTRGMTELTTRERKFFDNNRNTFDPDHINSASDSELMPRDRNWQFLTYLRGNHKVYEYNSSQSNATYADMYNNSGAVFTIWAHGWQRGCPPGDGGAVMQMKGYYTLFINPVPCSAGCYDYCNGYGITNTISFGESPIVSPHAGLASYANSRLGWVASYKTSSYSGSYSSLIEYYIYQCVSGVTRFQETGAYELMDAGEALTYAKNNYHDNYSSMMWGLAGCQVAGQGDPLARLPVQHSRVWTGNAGNSRWSTNDVNWQIAGTNTNVALDQTRDIFLPLATKGGQKFEVDGEFSAGAMYVEQDVGSTLEIAGTNGYFKVFREAVITNGNLRWTASGGIGRDGIKFAGTERGDIILPGNAERYFGDNFVHVGKIDVSGGNVTLDFPRGAQFGDGNALDFQTIAFVATNASDVTEWNTLRSREPGLFKTDSRLPVVNSKLRLETYNIGGSGGGNIGYPLIYATNSTIQVRPNPRWFEGTREEYFVRPTYLHNSTLMGDYSEFAFGSSANTGYDLWISGTNTISGGTAIKLNGELRIHFLDASAHLDIANTLCDGTTAGSVKFIGAGSVTFSAKQSFTGELIVPDGVTVRTTLANAFTGSITVEDGGKLVLDSIPLADIAALTVKEGGSLYLPGTTANSIYQIADVTTCNLTVENGAHIFDSSLDKEVHGDLTEGCLIQTENVLYWKQSGNTWDFTAQSWTNSAGTAKAFSDGMPLIFQDTGDSSISVAVATNVAPGFMDFRNTAGNYVFTGDTNVVSVASLALSKNVTFDLGLAVTDSMRVNGGCVEVKNLDAPLIDVASNATMHVTGVNSPSAQKVRKLRFEFSETYTSGNRAAIQEMRLYTADGFFRLPVGTVIADIAGQSVTITGEKGDYGHTMTGHTGDEQVGALVDGTLGGSSNNKWWASKSASPTWFEITFPEPVGPFTGYNFYTADSNGRNPRAWLAYSSLDGTRWAKAAQVSNCNCGSKRAWMTNESTPFGFVNANAFLTVKNGGTLYANGLSYVNLELQAGATLAVTNLCSFTNKQSYAVLTLPESGTISVDFSSAAKSKDAFPIFCGFNLTAEQFNKFVCVQETAMLRLVNGDIYAATDGVAQPPYSATIGDSSVTSWNMLPWKDKNGDDFVWDEANLKSDGTATITVNADATIANDVQGTIAKVVVTGSHDLTVNAVDGGNTLEPAVLDDSTHTGRLYWNVPLRSTAITCGSDTVLGGGEQGSGLLTVGANKKVTFMEGVNCANRSVNALGWIRYEEDMGDFELAAEADAIYSFKSANLIGDYMISGKTIRAEEDDYIFLLSTNISYYACTLMTYDIRGGTVETKTTGNVAFNVGHPNGCAPFTMSGGTFRCYPEEGTSGGLTFGYQGNTASRNYNIAGGLFEVADSIMTFSAPAVFDLSGNSCVKAGGYVRDSSSTGTFYLGTNNTSTATLAIGSSGFSAGTGTITAGKDSAIVGFEDGASIAANVALVGENVSVAATNGATFALNDVTFTGDHLVVFGKQGGWDGTVKVDDTTVMPQKWTVRAGTLDLGTLRITSDSILSEQPTVGGKILIVISAEEFRSGLLLKFLKCDDWATGLANLGDYFILKVREEDGTLTTNPSGTFALKDGMVTFLPEGACDYEFPLYATATNDVKWTKLDWRDAKGQQYTNNWYGVTAAVLTNDAASCTVTMDAMVSMGSLATVVPSGKALTISATTNTCGLALSEALDDSASTGTTTLDITLGAGMTAKAGKNLKVKGAANSKTVHGKLIIGAGSTVTVMDGLWNGEVDIADKSSTLRFEGDTVLDSVPSANSVTNGTIVFDAPMRLTEGSAIFGNADSTSANVNYIFSNRFELVTANFIAGVGNGATQTFTHKSGDINIVSNVFVLGSGTGGKVSYTLNDGNIYATNAVLRLGGTEPVEFYHYAKDKVVSVKGIDTGDASYASMFTLWKSILEIGSGGIHIVSTVNTTQYKPLCIFSSIIRATEDAVIDVPGTILSSVTTFATTNNATLTVSSVLTAGMFNSTAITVEGDGVVVFEKTIGTGGAVNLNSGVLRLAECGLLTKGDVKYNGGKIEVAISEADANTTTKMLLFPSTAELSAIEADTSVVVAGLGCKARGTFTKESGNVYFTPSPLTKVTATIEDSSSSDWASLTWKDQNGDVISGDLWNMLVGDIVITNAGNRTMSFTGTCSAMSLTIINSGTLNLVGGGSLSVATVNDSASTGKTTFGAFLSVTGTFTAGTDSVIVERGDYNVTVDTGKKVTIPGWTTPSKVTGAGTVAIDMGERETLLGSYWTNNGGVSGTNQVVCGTWEMASKVYPSAKRVLISGTNAVLRLKDVNDITGYTGTREPLTVENGGEFQVYKRDTFNRALYLRNGGKLLFGMDVSDNSRVFDIHTECTLSVDGSEPSIIGGVTASADAYGNPTVNSGVIAIRRSNFTVNVAKDSTLKVYSKWSTADGGKDGFIKSGAGTMEQYRDSSSALPFTVSQGTLRLVNAGTVTTGAMTANLGSLEVSTAAGYTKTLNNKLTIGANGVLRKTGAGTLVLNNTGNAISNLCIDAGEVRPTTLASLGGAEIAVKSGGTLNIGSFRLAGNISEWGGVIRTQVTQGEKNGEDWIKLFPLATGVTCDLANLKVYDTDGTSELTDVEKKVEDNAVWIKCQAYRMPLSYSTNASVEQNWNDATWMDANYVQVPSVKWAGLYGRTNLAVVITANNGVTAALKVNAPIKLGAMTITNGTGKVELMPTADGYSLTSGVTVVDGKLQVFGGVELGAVSGTGTLIATNFIPAYAGLFDAEKWHGTLEIWNIATNEIDVAKIANASSTVAFGGVTVNSTVAVPADYNVAVAAGGVFEPQGLSVMGKLSIAYAKSYPTPLKGDVTVAGGAVLEIAMQDFSLSVPVTENALVIESGAKVYINGVERPAGTYDVAGGAISLPITEPLKATVNESAEWRELAWFDSSEPSVPIDPSFWASSCNTNHVELTVNSNAALTAGAAMTVGNVKVTGDGELTLPASNFTMGNLTGTGTVILNGKWTPPSGVTSAEGWTGLIKLTGTLPSLSNFDFNTLGNASSRIEIAGTMQGGYVTPGGSCAIPLCVSGTFYLNNGNSAGSNGYTFSGALTGNGTLKVSGNPNDVTRFTGDVSGFTGAVQVATTGQCLAFGEQTDESDNCQAGKFVIYNRAVTLPANKSWTASNGIWIRGNSSVTIMDGQTAFGSSAVFESTATLNIQTDDTTKKDYLVTSGTLTLPNGTSVTLNGEATADLWVANGGNVERADTITAADDAELTAEYDGKPIVLLGSGDKAVTVDAAIAPNTIYVRGNETLNLKLTDDALITGTIEATASVRIDASEVNAYAMATNAVAGAPYSRWLVKGTVTGDVKVEHLPFVPMGYSIAADYVTGYGIRLVVTATDDVKYGSVNINIAGGRSNNYKTESLVGSGTAATQSHGAHPVIGSAWNDNSAANNTYAITNVIQTDGSLVTNGTVSMKLSGVNNPYDTGNTGHIRLLYGYADDSANPKIELSKIPFAKYRVIVYRSTDSGGSNYSAVDIGTTASDAVCYNGPSIDVGTRGYTVSSTSRIGWGDSDYKSALIEGVNYVVSDVLTGEAGKATAYIYSHKHSGRACVAAIQVVEVGKLYEIPGVAYQAEVIGSGSWNSGNGTGLANHNTWANHTNSTIQLSMKTTAATLTFDTVVTGATLSVVSEAGQTLTLAKTDNVDFEIGNYDFSAAAGTVNMPVGAYVDSVFTPGSGAVGAKGGTYENPLVITNTAGTFNGKNLSIAENSYLKMVNGTGNKMFKIAGAGASSVLIVESGTSGWGLDSGAEIRNLTLVADDPKKNNFWIEQRTPAAFDSTVDVVATNGSPITVGGGSVDIGSLAGDGNLIASGSGALVLHMDRAPTTYSGVCAVPLTVTGTHPLTLTGANTCALTVESGATVILADGGTVGAIAGDGTVTVNAGTLNVAIGSTLALTFADNTTLNLTGTLTEGGTFSFASSVTGNPTVTLNGGDLPSYCRIEGNSIVVTPEQKSWNNPVTGDAVNFSYAFFGTSDANWATIGNWREYGTISWNTMTGTAPMLSGSSRWNPTVIDGALIADASRKTITLSGTNMEGWTPRLALFNGVNVTIGNMTKLQSEGNGVKWVWVDGTSKLTFTQIASGNFSHDFKLYVAGKDGLTFTQAIPKDGTTFEYYLSTNGTVRYEAELTKCSHTIKQFCLTMDKPSAYKIIKERTLVTYLSTTKDFTTNSITVPAIGDVTPTNLGRAPTTADDFGAYGVVKGDKALVVKYVDYSQFYTNLADNAEIAVSTINALAATAGSEPYHVVFGKGVTVVYDAALTADNVEFDYSQLTADTTFVKAGSVTLTLDGAAPFASTIEVSAGTLSIPADTLTNPITLSGGTLNLSIPDVGSSDADYTISSGAVNGVTTDKLTVNGAPLSETMSYADGVLSVFSWDYNLTLAMTANVATTTAAWTDGNSREYGGGFSTKMESVTVDGVSLDSGIFHFVNDVANFATENITFTYFWGGELVVSNAADCVISADAIDCLFETYPANEMPIHLMFNTGSATIIPGQDTRLYCDGSGAIAFRNAETQLTFAPQAGTNLTYSGAITGAGKVVKDGAGTLTLTGANAFTGGFTVKQGTVVASASGNLGTGTVTVKSGATLTLDIGSCSYNLAFEDGAILNLIGTLPDAYTITSGSFSGNPVVTVNGSSIDATHVVEGNTISRRVYVAKVTDSSGTTDSASGTSYETVEEAIAALASVSGGHIWILDTSVASPIGWQQVTTKNGTELLELPTKSQSAVAFWDNDFTGADDTDGAAYHKFAIKANGNTLAADKSTLTISQENGVLIDWDSSLQAAITANGGFADKNITILVRYSNLKGRSGNYGCLGTLFHSDDSTNHYDYAGIMTDMSNASDAARNKAYGIVNSVFWSSDVDKYQRQAQVPVEASDEVRTLAIVYNPASAGTECYISQDGTNYTAYLQSTGLKTTSATYLLRGAALGGVRNPTVGNVKGMTGLNIHAVAVFNTVLTAGEMAMFRFPSESEKSAIAYNVTWGNVGSTVTGVATNQDGAFGYSPWKVKFAADDNVVSELSGKYGFVNVKSLRLMKRNDKANVPTSVTLTQGDISVTSGAPTTETGMNVYDTSGTAMLSTAREGAVFTFDSSAKFDVTKEITLTLTGNNGSSVMQPANSVMKYTSNGKTWSPILEFTMDEYAARIEPVYMLNYYHKDGQQQDGWINHTQTGGANITAPSSNGVSFVVYGPSGNNYKAEAVSVPSANFSTGSYVDIHGKAHASLLDEIAASAGVDVSQVLKTGLANGASGNGTATATGLTAGQRYVVYFGFGICGSADPNNGFTMLTNGYGTLDSLDYVVTGAGQNTSVATQYTSFNAGTNIMAADNAMMMVRAVLTPTSDGEIKINLTAGRSAISFVVISKVTKDITEYTATVSKDTDFADIVWTPTKPASGFGADDVLTITALNNPTITFAETVSTEAKLTIDGAVKIAAADSLYDDPDLVHKTLAAFDKITAPDITFVSLRSGYQGAYTQTDSSIVLHAQSGEIISLNIAGGDNKTGTSPDAHKTTGTGYYGLALVQGNTWINQTDKWASSTTKNFPSVVATADGSTTIDRSTAITATCAANNTYLWNSATDPFLKGYLDDGGTHAQVTVTGLQYPTYDVIVYFATDTADRKFDAVTVNGTSYVYDSANPTIAKAGTGSWGLAQSKTAVYGTNALRVRGLSDTTLTIVGGSNDGSTKRGGIAAVQIVATNPWPVDGKIIIKQGDVDLGTRRGDIEVQGTATVKFHETINDCGAITLTVSDPSKVTIVRADGTTAIEPTATNNGDGTYTFRFEPQLDGTACWWDYEFDGNASNTGAEGGGFSWDDPRPFKDAEYAESKALYVASRPYRSVTWPTEDLTFVIYGKMVSEDNAYQLCFGTKDGNLIFLATGSVADDEVVLCLSKSGTVTKLKTMTVPNAQTADHLYAFTLKTVANESVIDIYLDGQMLESYNAGTKVSLGGGFQIASPHGGLVTGYSRTVDSDTATIDFLRVYKYELSTAAMKAYAEEYPYVSPNGSYTREVEGGDVTWKTDDDSWQQKGEGGTFTNAPAEKATVELSATDDTTVTMELTKDVTYEALTIDGDGEVTITNATDAVGQMKITGRLTVNTDATIDPAAIDIANTPITVAAGKTLTIDMTGVDLDDVLQTTTYKLTGLVSEGEGSEVAVATNAYEEIDGRTVALAPNADQHYELKVEVVPEEVTLALDLDNDSKEVSFGGTDTLDIPLDWTLQLTNTTALTHGKVTKTTVAAALNATNTTDTVVIPNGIKPWESYVLTLSPTNQYSVPVIAPIQGTETDKITFALDNVAVRSEVSDKVNVTYKVYSGTTIGAKTEVSESAGPNEQIKFALPSEGVKYYHIEVDIAPKP